MKNNGLARASRILVASTLLLAASDLSAQIGVDDVIAVGPVTSVSTGRLDFSVLGRGFHADSPVAFGIGQYVAVHGLLQSDGSAKNVWVELMGSYVPGSDPVYEKGVISEVRPFLGQLSIGGSSLDYTPAMSAGSDSMPGIGAVIAISGVQPAEGSAVLVDNLMAAAERVRDSLMKGGGVEASLMKGGGIETSLMKGGGVQSSLMKGGGNSAS